MMTAGIVLTSAGGLAVIIGASVIAAQSSKQKDIERLYGCESGTCPPEAQSDLDAINTRREGAAIAGVSGLLVLGVGIPLLVVGARKKKVGEAEAALPRIEVVGAGARLTWSF